MSRFNKYIEFVDYGDVVNALQAAHNIDSEDAFYFWEECELKEEVLKCKSYDSVIEKVVELYKGETY